MLIWKYNRYMYHFSVGDSDLYFYTVPFHVRGCAHCFTPWQPSIARCKTLRSCLWGRMGCIARAQRHTMPFQTVEFSLYLTCTKLAHILFIYAPEVAFVGVEWL
jgi:hypothetical protein